MSSSIFTGVRKVGLTTFAALMAMSVLAACEKGLYIKDAKITAPDFQLTTQEGGGAVQSKVAYTFDLKSLIVTEETTAPATPQLLNNARLRAAQELPAETESKTLPGPRVESSGPTADVGALARLKAAQDGLAISTTDGRQAGENVRAWTGLLEFSVANKTAMQERVIQLEAKAVIGENTTGTIETNPGEPTMTWNARCEDVECSRYYLAIMMNFIDENGDLRDTRILVIGWYRDLKQLKRAMFKHDGKTKSLTDYIKDLELQEEEVRETVLKPASESLESFDVGFDENIYSSPEESVN